MSVFSLLKRIVKMTKVEKGRHSSLAPWHPLGLLTLR